MTLAARNALFTMCVVLSGALLAAFSLALLLTGRTSPIPLPDLVPSTQRWFVWTWEVEVRPGVLSMAGLGVFGFVSFSILVVSSRVFRRVTSAEIYFFAIFLFTLAVEQLRFSQLLVIIWQQPPQYGVAVTRVVMFARLVGSFSLFTASLYAVGVDFPRIGSLTLLTAVLAFVVVWFVPVDTLHLTVSLVHVSGGGGTVDIVLIVLAMLTVADYTVAAVRGHRERGLEAGLSAAAMVVGRELLFRSPSPVLLAVGGAILLYGCVTYVVVNRQHFLWY